MQPSDILNQFLKEKPKGLKSKSNLYNKYEKPIPENISLEAVINEHKLKFHYFTEALILQSKHKKPLFNYSIKLLKST
ncbi:hypothetical protein CDL12_11144 [Handroanthus impetiginosus]|uniref:Uncharacterized protein n=1 Tax=Handroanthus impetiginosus TaxID=429701 RepID=A0A2G9HF96_9LAMI|nr:hypothetical protein CDL12_11144 [Handroanthus impetiginosus]